MSLDLTKPLRIRTRSGRAIPVLRVISEDGPNIAPIVVVAKGDSGSGGELVWTFRREDGGGAGQTRLENVPPAKVTKTYVWKTAAGGFCVDPVRIDSSWVFVAELRITETEGEPIKVEVL